METRNRRNTGTTGLIGSETLPTDLQAWFAPATLRSWIEEDIATLDWNHPRVVAWLRARPDFQPRILFSVLTFAYATGVLDSEEIESRCATDPAYRPFIKSGWRADAGEFRRFRRQNRELLRWSLLQLFRRSMMMRSGESRPIARHSRNLMGSVAARLELAALVDQGPDGL